MSSGPPTPNLTPRPTPAASPGPTPTPSSQYSNMPTPSPQNYSQNPAPTPSSSRRSHLSSVGSTPMSRGDISRGIHRIVNHASMSSSSGGGDNNFSITGTPQTPNIRNRNRNNDSNSDGNFSDHSSIRTPGGGANGILVHSTPHIPFDFDKSTPATPNGSTTWESDADDASQGHEEFGHEDRNFDGNTYGHPRDEAYIWGTTVNVNSCLKMFRRFINDFYLDSSSDLEPYYMRQLRALDRSGSNILNVNCQHLHRDARYKQLYLQLVQYPQEIIPIMDAVVNEEYSRINGRTAVIRTCTFGLIESRRMRALDPSNIDTLVSIKGMITRCSTIIPDLKQAFFKCTRCPNITEVMLDRGRIDEPSSCPACQTKNSMEIIHNRCLFSDKQMIRMQETSEEVPEGEMPYSTSIYAFDDLVDSVRPGDRIEVTGIYRAVPKRPNPRMRTIKSVYKTYIDCIHFRRIDAGEHTLSSASTGGSNSTTASANSTAPPAFTEEKVRLFRRFAQQNNVYDQLVAGLAPSIWELDDVKRGVLCMLFGGNTPEAMKIAGRALDEEGMEDPNEMGTIRSDRKVESRQRNEVNILLCGDPGTSKSQLLSYVHKLSPRGIYTSGRGSSAVGLTASVVRDTESKELVLESGALVLSDNGICCIDEFDKMTDTTRAILHEAMEQQTVSITKAGIVATLNARTAILASANPVESRYNPRLSVVENIKLPPTLLSRFDLIYLILDKPNIDQDRKLAKHIVSLYYDRPEGSVVGARGSRQNSGSHVGGNTYLDSNDNIICNQEFIKEYVLFARSTVAPDLSGEAKQALVDGYLEMRGAGMHKNGNKTITATTRQLESLIRISQAMAKMRLQKLVTRADVAEAIRLMKVATQTAATDPRTGTIDIDMITTGRSSVDRDLISKLVEELRNLLSKRHGERMTLAQIRQMILNNLNQNNGHLSNAPSGPMGSSHNDRGDITNVSTLEIEEAVKDLQAEGILQFMDSMQMVIIR